MVQRNGGEAAPDQLLASANPSAGSTELFLRGRENLEPTVEYLVLQEPWSQPFGDEQFAVARKRLREVTVEPPGSSA